MRSNRGLHPAPQWVNRWARLGPSFYTPWQATPLPEATWVAWSNALATDLGWPSDWHEQPGMIDILAGNQPWPGSEPLASVYSGHQFGVWAGQLGDGRALWLGEISSPMGPQEIQLKGAGPTPYSRRADGRAVLRSSIREFLCSEAMHGLGIPTTRALALVASPQPVWRETAETAAVVTRVAPSFMRFGHFEHFASIDDLEALTRLLEFSRTELGLGQCPAAHPGLALLLEVTQRTAELMARWQAVGFCHGVMNTDNMSLLGLTLDYGPFQFMDAYDPGHICNHTDTQGRYAFARQPRVAHWNLHALGQALMALVDDADAILAVLQTFPDTFEQAWLTHIRGKLGLTLAEPDDLAQCQELFRWMAEEACDHTIFWRRLSHAVALWQGGLPSEQAFSPVSDLALQGPRMAAWLTWLRQRLNAEGRVDAGQRMLRINPKFVLRNHLAEQAIRASQSGSHAMVRDLLAVLQSPYDEHPDHEDWAGFPPDWAQHIEISCSS
ncbi:MAG: YdiU family protein [Alphaproteobacteria bacterium]|nr:YdiU family protein [Alphaproteobacteria bacterium]